MRSFLISVSAIAMVAAAYAAPIPKERPKSQAEQFVGTWKMIKSEDKPLESGMSVFLTAAKDGTYAMTISLGDLTDEITGTWKLDGIYLKVEAITGSQKGEKNTVVVKMLTDTKLITEVGDDKQLPKKRSEFIRVTARVSGPK